MSNKRRKPTSSLKHEVDKSRDALYDACREGHVKDIKKLRPAFNKACEDYERRLEEDAKIAAEKEAKKQARKTKKNGKK